jgi:hypothetical protein
MSPPEEERMDWAGSGSSKGAMLVVSRRGWAFAQPECQQLAYLHIVKQRCWLLGVRARLQGILTEMSATEG